MNYRVVLLSQTIMRPVDNSRHYPEQCFLPARDRLQGSIRQGLEQVYVPACCSCLSKLKAAFSRRLKNSIPTHQSDMYQKFQINLEVWLICKSLHFVKVTQLILGCRFTPTGHVNPFPWHQLLKNCQHFIQIL